MTCLPLPKPSLCGLWRAVALCRAKPSPAAAIHPLDTPAHSCIPVLRMCFRSAVAALAPAPTPTKPAAVVASGDVEL